MANYTVNAYNNNGVGGTVNMRTGASTGAAVVKKVPHGAPVTGTRSGTWSYMTYNQKTPTVQTYSGYMMSVYLDDAQGGGNTGGGAYLGQGTVIGGGALYCRKQPITGYADWGRFSLGASVPIYACSTAGWYETRWPATGTGVGFVMSQYISLGSGGGNTGGGTASSLPAVRNGDATLRLNDSGAAVAEVRRLLSNKGVSINNTTSQTFDANMRSAVIAFQNGYAVLASDGIVGQCTLAVLEDTSTSTNWFVDNQRGTCNLTAGKLVLCGFVGKHVINPDHVQRLNGAINNSAFNFTRKVQIRHFLAQGMKECDRGNTMTEYIYQENSSAHYDGFYGAGFMQLTGSDNYTAFHNWLQNAAGYGYDGNVTAWRTATKRVANHYPMVSAAWYFSQHNASKDINNEILALWNSSVDTTVQAVTRLVQGTTGSWAERKTYYEKIKTVLL